MEHRLPHSITAEQRERLQQLFEWLVDPCVAFVRKHCKYVLQWDVSELVCTAHRTPDLEHRLTACALNAAHAVSVHDAKRVLLLSTSVPGSQMGTYS